jgi:hypothetical protein
MGQMREAERQGRMLLRRSVREKIKAVVVLGIVLNVDCSLIPFEMN